jgi:GTP-binding protein
MLKIKTVDFFKTFVKVSAIPDSDYPEIAFIGRSNVGKSSLINDLCNRKTAKTSSTPGKTRAINFFRVNDLFYMVDLPGYGYAKVSTKEQRSWPRMIEEYLQNRRQLCLIFMLLDIRRKPNEHDRMLIEWLKQVPDIEICYVLTKSDKFSTSKAMQAHTKIALDLMVDKRDFIRYSVTKKRGRPEILQVIEKTLEKYDSPGD